MLATFTVFKKILFLQRKQIKSCCLTVKKWGSTQNVFYLSLAES